MLALLAYVRGAVWNIAHNPDLFPRIPGQLRFSTRPPAANMSGNYTKIAANSPSRASPSEIEVAINNALEDLQNNIPDLRSSLRPLQFVSAREVR